MIHPDFKTSVAQWVVTHPPVARVFEELRIDYCCGGDKSLERACRERQLDLSRVLEKMAQAIADDNAPPIRDWAETALTELCDHIERTHHAYLRTELPRLTGMIAKVVDAHGARHTELAEVQRVFAALRAELEPHMFKEEKILFPAIRQIERTRTAEFPFGTVANPIGVMEHEHEAAGQALTKLHQLTDSYRVPNDACPTYRALLEALRKLESDMHQHVHLENNILFPRAEELEKSVTRFSTLTERVRAL